jgi:hypothetical protein
MKPAIVLRNVCPIKVVPVKTHLKPTLSQGRAKVVEVLRVLVGGDEEGDGSAGVMRIEVDWETRLDGQSSRNFVIVFERGALLTRDIAGQGHNVSRTAGFSESTAELYGNNKERLYRHQTQSSANPSIVLTSGSLSSSKPRVGG